MNGAPVKLRYRANRMAIDDARRIEKQRTGDHRLTPGNSGRATTGSLPSVVRKRAG